MTIALLIDNDIVIKLACMNAYQDSIASAGFHAGQVGSIGVMLRYMGRASEERRLILAQGDKAHAESLKQVLHSITEVEPTEQECQAAASVMKVALLNEIDMQEGELTLMVVAASRGGIEIATGDKRALRSLPDLQAYWPALAALMGKFICLEQIFKTLCQRHGLKRVRDALAAAPKADSTINFVFDETNSGGATKFIAGLDFVTQEQIRKPAPGWLKP